MWKGFPRPCAACTKFTLRTALAVVCFLPLQRVHAQDLDSGSLILDALGKVIQSQKNNNTTKKESETRAGERAGGEQKGNDSGQVLRGPSPPKPPVFRWSPPKFGGQQKKAGQAQQNSGRPGAKGSQGVSQIMPMELSSRVVLGNGQEILGKILVNPGKNGEIQVSFQDKGVRYHRKIALKKISRVSILKWEQKLEKKKKNGQVFGYQPEKIQLRLKNGESLVLDRMPAPFRKFILSNKKGKTTLFAFFGDFKNPDGSWRERDLAGQDPELIPHPRAVRQIVFAP